jgi:hypothetical protein
MAARALAGHRRGEPNGKEAVQMTGLRRVFAWLIVSVVVVMLVAMLVLEDAS